MTMRVLPALLFLCLLAACASGGGAPGAMPGAVAPRGSGAPGGPIDLGDWRSADANAVMQRYSTQILRRYAVGSPLPGAIADLKANQFACSAPSAGKAGDPPTQVCRRQITASGCTHTWQAHLWADKGAAKLTRMRALYDKRCAKDGGLLGGPG